MPAKTRKKITNAEKNLRKQVKKEMQADGFLPPDKKRLNRKRFVTETMAAVDGDDFSFYDDLPHIVEAFSYMLPYIEAGKVLGRVITPEQIGVVKVLKIAVDIKKFWKLKSAEGVKEVNTMEFYEAIVKPIVDL